MRYALRNYQSPRRYIPMNRKREESLQKQVCNYLRQNYPAAIFRTDFTAGRIPLTPNQARQYASLQSGRAFPDIFVFTPSRQFYGLALELKKDKTTIYVKRGPRKGELTADEHVREQALMLQELNRLGYFARFGVGLEACKRLIDWYMQPDYKEPEATELF